MIKDIEEVLTRFEKEKVIINKESSTIILAYVRKELIEGNERGYYTGYNEGLKKNKRWLIWH